MKNSTSLPQLSAARVLTSGGPYAEGAVVSLAFIDPHVGRLVAHQPAAAREVAAAGPIVPDTISVQLLSAAPPYECGETIALSFVDPAIARIHRWSTGAVRSYVPAPEGEEIAARESVAVIRDDAPVQTSHVAAAGLRLEWSVARVGRLLALSEKLLSIDRLGWYRHTLAMRLLLPDEVVLADDNARDAAGRQLRALKIAATEALGTPLLAALMPSFTLDEEWLRSIETPALARAAATLRETLREHAGDGDADVPSAPSERLSTGTLRRAEVERAERGGLDAFLAALIPCEGATPEIAGTLSDYKAALVELFGQTAQASATVRITRLATPNPVLDERLSAVAREIDRAFGRLAVA